MTGSVVAMVVGGGQYSFQTLIVEIAEAVESRRKS